MRTRDVTEQLRVFRTHINLVAKQDQWNFLDFTLAGVPLRIRSPNAEMMQTFARPFVKSPINGQQPRLVLTIVTFSWLREQAISPLWHWEFDTYSDVSGSISFDRVFGAMTAIDLVNATHLLAIDNLEPSVWSRPEQSRPFIEQLFASQGYVSLHGGTIGRGNAGILLSARGGSGKSSLVAAAIRRGLNTTGDDFLLLEPGAKNSPSKIWSLYRWIKMASNSPAWIASTEDFDLVDKADIGEKSIVSFERLHAGALTRYQVPQAIVVPYLGETACLRSIPRMEALEAVLPSSVAMSSRKVEATFKLRELVEELPCYSLELSDNLEHALDLLDPLLP